MLAEWSVELGAEDSVLELPWKSSDANVRYIDLKSNPESLAEVPEASSSPAVGEFLRWANAPDSQLRTAKCDVWSSREISIEEEVFSEPWKYGCYIDLLFDSAEKNSAFETNELFVQEVVRMLRQTPDIPSMVEFAVRRLIKAADGTQNGYYVTLYVHGYGSDVLNAQDRWRVALRLVQQAIAEYLNRS